VLRFIAKHKGASAAAAVVLLALVMAVSSFYTKGRTSPLSGAVNTVFRPLHSLIGSIGDTFTGLSDAVKKYDELQADYERLRVFLAQIEAERRLTDEYREENELLRELLGLAPREKGIENIEMASIASRGTSEWERVFTLGKGSEAGFEVGQCVLSSEMYLVGIISQVGPGWSLVRTVTDTTMSAGGKVARTGQTAVAEGDWNAMREGRLQLNYLPLGSDILHGDLILTSGLGGVYPPGLPIGTVAGVRSDLSGQTEVAELIPMADLTSLKQVFVVLDYAGKG
jgi:rod shape-determining protein MreC